MDGDNVFGLNQLDRPQRIVWAHGEIVADGQNSQVNSLLTNQAMSPNSPVSIAR